MALSYIYVQAQAAQPLQKLDDLELADSTGEGIAFLPTEASLQFNGANTIASTKTNMVEETGNGNPGTGYIHILPVGPLTKTSKDTNKDGSITNADRGVGKADIYLYGLAISQSNKSSSQALDSTDWNTRFGKNITSWGSSDNPWVLKVATAKDVPNFSASSSSDMGKGDISYLSLESPLMNTITTIPSDSASDAATNGSGAYNLKMGLWMDTFVRDASKTEGSADQFGLGQYYGSTDNSRANRIRLQAIWDGFSINGSNIKLFQTLGGALASQNMSTSYNNTLGLAGVIRLNSGDSANLKATFSTATRYYGGNFDANGVYTGGGSTTASDNQYVMSDITAYGCNNDSKSFGVAACEYRFRSRKVTDNVSGGTWTAPSVTNVMRLSTKETSTTSTIATPAIDGGGAPTFASATDGSNDGLYLYNPNINLVLGTLYQPLTLGVAGDGKNIVIEIAQIPNKEAIFKQIYTNYDNTDPTTNGGYYGSTCNIYQCGTNGSGNYQGNNATHSSITIGSTIYNPANNTLTALKTNGAVGISFGTLQNRTGINASKTYTQWQDQQRAWAVRNFNWTDTYSVRDKDAWFVRDENKTDPYTGQMDCNAFFSCNRTAVHNGTTQTIGSTSVFVPKGSHSDWIYRSSGNADSPVYSTSDTTRYTDTQIANCNSTTCDSSASASDSGYLAARNDNLNWTNSAHNANWADSTAKSLAIRGVTADMIPVDSSNSINLSPSNNFGSAVIDGLLIQHMKITTKGL